MGSFYLFSYMGIFRGWPCYLWFFFSRRTREKIINFGVAIEHRKREREYI